MKFCLRLLARPGNTKIEDRHKRLVDELKAIQGPWGLRPGSYPAPTCGTSLSGRFSLGKNLGKGIRGFVDYRYRGGLSDSSQCDDILDLEFNTQNIDFEKLVRDVFPCYAAAIDAYYGHIGACEFMYLDFERSRNVDGRSSIIRFHQTAFFDAQFCERAMRMGPKEVFDRIRNVVGDANLFGNGVIYSAGIAPLSLHEANEFDRLIRLTLSLSDTKDL